MTLRLATERRGCVLRSWIESDKAALVRLANSRAVWRNLTERFPHPYTAADAAGWVEHANDDPPSLHLAIELDGELVGGVGIDAGQGIRRRTGLVGYWLGEAYWGRGLATAAVRAMVGHACTELPFARLQAEVFAWNPASMRVLEKAGFEREAVLRRSVFKDGMLTDGVLYAYLTGV